LLIYLEPRNDPTLKASASIARSYCGAQSPQ
jgi:hypothetical protein